MRSKNEVKINQLLRLAELCDSSQIEQKRRYMELAENLILEDSESGDAQTETYLCKDSQHLIDFYNQYKSVLIGGSSNSNYQLYLEFCKENEISPFARLPFSQRMCNYFPLKSVVKRINKNRTVKVWISTEDLR